LSKVLGITFLEHLKKEGKLSPKGKGKITFDNTKNFKRRRI
jgi:hypothetical protein